MSTRAAARPGRAKAGRLRERDIFRGGGALLAVCLLACLTSACSTTPPDASPPASQAGSVPSFGVRRADALVGSTMATNNRANARLDRRLLATYETGSALAIDASQYRAARLSGARADSVPFGLRVRQIVLGQGSVATPAGQGSGSGGARSRAGSGSEGPGGTFVAVGETYEIKAKGSSPPSSSGGGACAHSGSLLLFERRSGGRYKISLEPSSDPGEVPALATSAAHVASHLGASLSRSSSAIPEDLATALERYEASGGLGQLSRSDFSGKCWALPDPRAELQRVTRAGFEERTLFSPVGDAVTYKLARSGALVVFTIRSVETIVAPSARTSVTWQPQPSDPTTYLLAAGHYSRVTERAAIEIAAVTGGDLGSVSPATNRSSAFRIIGAYAGILSISGTRAAKQPGTQLLSD